MIGDLQKTSGALKRIFVFAAAYLLVLQAALAGGAMQNMTSVDGFATAVICLNGDTQSPAEGDRQHVSFDCCGLGCLVGAHALEGPASPDSELAYPAERPHQADVEPGALRSRTERAHGPGLRGPPTAA